MRSDGQIKKHNPNGRPAASNIPWHEEKFTDREKAERYKKTLVDRGENPAIEEREE